MLDFGCGAGGLFATSSTRPRAAPSTAGHRRAEHRLARGQPEPPAPRLRQRRGAAAAARDRVARPDLGDLGLHAHLGSLGRLARRAAPAASGGRLALATILGPALSEEWTEATPDPRVARGQQVAEAATDRDERPPSRTLLGSGRAGGVPLRLVGRGALGPRLRDSHAPRGRLRRAAPDWRGQGVCWPGSVRSRSPSRSSRGSIPAIAREIEALRHNIRQLHHESRKAPGISGVARGERAALSEQASTRP